jgi:hypothetical protein
MMPPCHQSRRAAARGAAAAEVMTMAMLIHLDAAAKF